MIVYLLIGMPCSGKTTARKYLSSYGLHGYEASNFLRRRMKSERSSSVEDVLLRNGRDIVAWDIIKELWLPAVISGFRTSQEIKLIRKFCRTIVIALDSPVDVCFMRACKRDVGKFLAIEEFIEKRIFPDKALGIKKILSNPDIIIQNTQSKDILYKQLDALVKGGGKEE